MNNTCKLAVVSFGYFEHIFKRSTFFCALDFLLSPELLISPEQHIASRGVFLKPGLIFTAFS